MEEEEVTLGPAMLALTPLQRGFVMAMLSDPLGTPTDWARLAGYPDTSCNARVMGHLNYRNPKIEAAASELARANLNTFGPVLGIGVMMMIAKNGDHPDQLKAAAMLANRSGFHEKTEHRVTVDRQDRTPKGIEARLARALDKLQKMGRMPVLPPPVDAEFKVIDDK